MTFSRCPRARRARIGASRTTTRRTFLRPPEQLEDRRLLSLASVDYDQPDPAWFAAVEVPYGPLTLSQAAVAAATASGTHADRLANPLFDPWIVRLTSEALAGLDTVADVSQRLNVGATQFAVVRGLGMPGQVLVSAIQATPAEVAAALRANPHVSTFERDAVITGQATPNDPKYASQIGLHNMGQDGGTIDADIDAPEAWNVTTGSRSVVVAVIDTGVDYAHPDLAANIWTNPGEVAGNGADDDHNGFVDDIHGYDFFNRDGNPQDDNRHGTHVAGTIAALGNNGLGVAGTAWLSSLMPVKFLDANNQGPTSGAIEAINYVTTMRRQFGVNVRAINASWGGSGYSGELRAEIATAGQADILFVAAAGNGDVLGRGIDTDETPFYPASYDLDNIISVAASDQNDKLARFSNYGPTSVDVAAPGVGIWSTEPGSSYASRNGTSMAAPHVTGTAALIWSKIPYATAAEVRQAILQSADVQADFQGDLTTGGRLNSYSALTTDTVPPRATLASAPNITLPGDTYQTITVTYTDDTAVDVSTLSDSDLVIMRPDRPGETYSASFISVSPSGNGPTRTATYRMVAPGGTWGTLDNGEYRIELVTRQVSDLRRNYARAVVLGSFRCEVTSDGVFEVNTTLDLWDENPGDGIADDGTGLTSLRAAVQESNAMFGPATIILPPGIYTLALSGADEDDAYFGDLDVYGQVTIIGVSEEETIIDGLWLDRVFDILPGASLTLANLTITGGNASDAAGGGLRNQGTLNLDHVTIADNSTGGVFRAAGPEVRVNTSTVDTQHNTDVACDAAGNSVVVWESRSGATSTYWFQRYAADGTTRGTATRVGDAVALGTVTWQPLSVAMDPNGSFVVAWTGYSGISANGLDIFAQRFKADGTVDLQPLTVNSFRTNNQVAPSVAVDATGAFVIAWQDEANRSGNATEIYAQRYRVTGVKASVETRLNTFTAGDQRSVDVAIDADGVFVATWESWNQDTSGWGIVARKGNVANATLSAEISVNTTTVGDQRYPAVALDSAKQFLVTWQSAHQDGDNTGIIARRFDAAGQAASAEFVVNATTAGAQTDPSIALAADGTFVVVWTSVEQDGSGTSLHGKRFSTLSIPRGEEFSVNLITFGDQLHPRAAIGADNSFVVTWDGNGVGDATGVHARRFNVSYQSQIGGGIENSGTLMLTDTTVTQNRSGGDGGGLHNTGTATVDSSTLFGNVADGQTPFSLEPIRGEFRISSTVAAPQYTPRVAFAPDGTSLVVWDTRGEEWAGAVYGQRLNAQGTLVNGELAISTDAGLDPQWQAAVAFDAQGNYVVTWTAWMPDGNHWGVLACMYAADGTPRGTPFLVNSYPTDYQAYSQIAIDRSGKFVIVWTSLQDGSGNGIYGQRYDALGQRQGGEFQVNTTTAGDQVTPEIVMDQDGNFVVAWFTSDFGGGISIRRYRSDGTPLTDEILVSSSPTAHSTFARIAADANGNLVVAWDVRTPDDTDAAIYARCYAHDGTPLGEAFRVNSTTLGRQESASVSMSKTGEFIVTWDSLNQDGDDWGVYGQLFDAAGNPVGTEFRVNTTVSGSQFEHRSAISADGRFLVVWAGNGPGDSQGIFGQLYQLSQSPTGNGGGIANEGTLKLTNVTLSGNEAAVRGGGLFNAVGAEATTLNCTITQNAALGGGGINNAYGGTVTPQNTIIAGNTAVHESVDVAGAFVTRTGNLLGNLENTSGAFATVVNPFRVNTTWLGAQTFSDVTALPNGVFVVVWKGNQTGAYLPYGQLIREDGTLLGSEFLIGNDPFGAQSFCSLSIASDAAGNFVVVWESTGADGDGLGILAQRFAPDGLPLGTKMVVNTTATGDQHEPHVAMRSDGTFVVVWASEGAIYGQFFTSQGQLFGTEFKVYETDMVGFSRYPSVAFDLAGNILVVCRIEPHVCARKLTSGGVPLGSSFLLDEESPQGAWIGAPVVRSSALGEFVVVWQADETLDGLGNDFVIFGRVLDADGAPIGSRFRLHERTAGQVYTVPWVSFSPSGNFLATWIASEPDGNHNLVYVREFDPVGQPLGPEIGVTEPPFGWVPRVTAATSGTYLLTWDDGWDGGEVYVTTMLPHYDNASGFFVPTTTSMSEFRVNSTTSGLQAHSDVAALSNGAFVVVWAGSQSGENLVYGQRFSDDGTPLGPEFLVGDRPFPADAFHGNSIASDAAGNFVVVAEAVGGDGDGIGIVAQRFSADGSSQGASFVVNSWTAGDQRQPHVAMRATGEFVVVWRSSDFEIHGQCLSAAGQFVGSEFRVNEELWGVELAVAYNVSGEIIVVWSGPAEQGAQNKRIYGRLLASDGTPVGGQFSVDEPRTFEMNTPVVRANPRGGFTVVWQENPEDVTVSARVFDANAIAIGPQFQVNQFAAGSQVNPWLTFNTQGNFLVAWESYDQLGPGCGVYAREFDSLGRPIGTEFVVQDSTSEEWLWQGTPRTTTTSFGAYVVTRSGNGPGDWDGVFASKILPSFDLVLGAGSLYLGALAANGGSTWTHALLPGSPAIDAGIDAGAPTTDQRGLPRPQDANGDGWAAVDIGAYEVYHASLQGTWFRDTNGNGVRDAGEVGVTGETVFLDKNGNGLLDDGELSATTRIDDAATTGVDEAGMYSFPQLAPGTYTVVCVLPDGWEAVAPVDGQQPLSLHAGQAATGVDFATRPRPAQIRGQVFHDANHNSAKDPEELGLASWTVYLDLNGDGAYSEGEPWQWSDSDGRYVFTDVVPLQNYTLTQQPEENWEQTYPAASGNYVWSVYPAAGEVITDRDFGNYDLTTGGQGTDGALAGRVFRDDDQDRVQDPTEPGLIGYTVYLDLNDNGVRDDGEPTALTRADEITTPTIDETGLYQFTGLAGSTYIVRLLGTSGAHQTAPVGNKLQPAAFDTGEGPQSVALGDFDRNGKPDLAIANSVTNNLSLLFNTGTGSFGAALQVAVGYGPAGVLAQDLDGDADVDLVAANLYGGTVSILKNRGTGSFEPPVNVAIWGAPRALSAIDFDHDGDIDLAVADEWNDAVALLRNNGAGIFTFIGSATVGLAPSALTTVQLNDDNGNGQLDVADWPDLVVTNFDANNLSVLLGRADGAFATAVEYTTGLGPFSIAAGDLDRDGYHDLVVANVLSNTVTVLRNLTTGTFAAPVTYAAGAGPSAVSVGDLDGDADLDLLVTNGTSKDLSVLRNRGNGTFEPAEDFGVGDFPLSLPFSVAAGDLNADNVLDVAVANGQANNVSVLLNTLVPGAHRSRITGSQTVSGLDFGVSLNNALPTLDAIPDPAAVDDDAPTQTVNLAGITAGGSENQALEVTAMSLNVDLVPDPVVQYTSPETTGTLAWQPVANQTGQALIQVTVRDAGPDGVLGTGDDGTFSRTFTVTVNSVADTVGRYLFYNQSAWDGNHAAANAADDGAIATEKTALMPGGTATFANYTSYERGINGLMIDVDDLAGTPTVADFLFRVGNSNTPYGTDPNSAADDWPFAPAPTSITVRPGAGVGGSDRVTVIWADNAIRKRWLQVTMLATDTTGLAQHDVFYFGNAVGESGNSTGDALVNATDEIGARNNPHSPFSPALRNDVYDYNRDKLVNATDQIIARNNRTNPFDALKLIQPPSENGDGQGEADERGERRAERGEGVPLLNPFVFQHAASQRDAASDRSPQSRLSSDTGDKRDVHDLALEELLAEGDGL